MMSTIFGRFCTALCLSVVVTAGHGAQAGETAAGSRNEVAATQQTVHAYFDRLQKGSGWQASFSEGMLFTIRTSSASEVRGKVEYLRASAPFYSMIRSVKLRELISDGARACALTRYELQPPNGDPAFSSDVAEIFTVRNGEIVALEIFFDTAPYPK